MVLPLKGTKYRRNTLENKVNIVIAQLDTPYTKNNNGANTVASKKHCPVKPEVRDPLSITRLYRNFHLFYAGLQAVLV